MELERKSNPQLPMSFKNTKFAVYAQNHHKEKNQNSQKDCE
jgi:hypothetical protein